MIQLSHKEWRIFRRLQRKHNVSTQFLLYNFNNIQKIVFHETWPRILLRRFAIRKKNRVFLVRNRLRRILFDQKNHKIFSRLRQNVRQWSKRVVTYRRRIYGAKEFVEDSLYGKQDAEAENEAENANVLMSQNTQISRKANSNSGKDVSEQLKEQLELLKTRSRQLPLMEIQDVTKLRIETKEYESKSMSQNKISAENNLPTPDVITKKSDRNLDKIANIIPHSLDINTDGRQVETETIQPAEVEGNQSSRLDPSRAKTDWQIQLENTPEKQIVNHDNVQPQKKMATDEKTESSQNEENLTMKSSEKMVKSGLNFLDMLMCKVSSKQAESIRAEPISWAKSQNTINETVYQHEHSLDSTDEFLGFEEGERLPGMLMTPVVPYSGGGSNKNSVFESETLNEYMRANDLETNYNIDDDKSVNRTKITHTDLEGLVTPKTEPPAFAMPAVPDNLLRFRTVAERKNYLSKCSKNYRLSIINNEANIYRDLQKRMRYQKTKHGSQILAQSANSSMSFTRLGWQTASFINTEFNKYYYQMLSIDHGRYVVKLKGVRGNNNELRKRPYQSTTKGKFQTCPSRCVDLQMWQDFKPILTDSAKSKKLNEGPLPSVFKPCPLSHKVLQKPLDDDAAALLLAGGSMAVVRMPTVELEVFPACGRPLNEIAKRYLQHILPHHDISREWAEFSVSTLRLPGSLKEAVQAAADSIPRKSFTFLIPYLNDRNHILVRRVVDRSEKLDESFENSLDSELVPKTDFTFRQNLDKADDILIECADIVSDMINTVAISCSENSFIKPDPDMLSEDKPEEMQLSSSVKLNRPCSGSPAKKPAKQKRVLLELRRLNATIIDAAVKPEIDKKPCTKEYCAMGCICNSLSEGSRMREHCGKAKCILECSCKGSNQSRIMRLETDGRSITTEDAFMLRRKATARLARMEKEFTSTVVLTENETLLINETNNDKKRRCTKLPKRYEYEDVSDDEHERMPLSKKTALTTIDNDLKLAIEVKEIRDPIYVQDTVLEQLKHCTINLVKLKETENIVPWCMVHQLYKCFCKGRSLEGKPMVIEKDENNTTVQHGEDNSLNVDYKINQKVRYTFEKVEKGKMSSNEDIDKSEDDLCAEKCNESQKPTTKSFDEKIKQTRKSSEQNSNTDAGVSHIQKEEIFLDVKRQKDEKPKRTLQDVRTRFYASRPECCRRQIPIPRRMFLYCNRKRRLDVLKYIKSNENEKTRLLLNEHVMRSVYYHKIDSEKSQKKAAEENAGLNKTKEIKAQENKTLCFSKESALVSEVVDLSDDDELPVSTNSERLLTKEEEVKTFDKNCPEPNRKNEGVITLKTFASLSKFDVDESRNNNQFTTTEKSEELKLPKISKCFSLNAKANMQNPLTRSPEKQKNLNHQHRADFTSATSVYSSAFSESRPKTNKTQVVQAELLESSTERQSPPQVDQDSVRDVYNNVIRTMNTLVSKKMQDVDFALKRESFIIPTPNADILCMMKWLNFLEAFSKGFAFIWQVKSREGTYLVATVQNMLPMICDALGVVNITALKPERLPLMGKMLLQNVHNEHTAKLAIVMQGKQSYWVVKGFLKAEPTTACNKPTPETHPSLTKKINVLCTSLVKQRQKDERNREMIAQRFPSSGKPSKVAQIMPTLRNQPMDYQHPLQHPHPSPTPPTSSAQLLKQSSVFVPPPPSTQTNSTDKSNTVQNSRKRKLAACDYSNSISDNYSSKMDIYAEMGTNIEFKKVSRDDINEIHLPEIHKENHKWLVLDLQNDFSHIFVPDFRDLVSLDRIQKVINFARQKNKIVKLQFFQNAPFDAFVTPKSGKKIYFGPLHINMKPPTLILLQSVDGQMMLRELYQQKHNIEMCLKEKTKAFWLTQLNGNTHFEVDEASSIELEKDKKFKIIPSATIKQQNILNNKDDEEDDEDCMIIDEVDDKDNRNTEGRYNFTISSKPTDNAITITSEINSLPGPLPIQPLNSSNSSVTITSTEPTMSTAPPVQKIPNTNTVIKPVLAGPITTLTNSAQVTYPLTSVKSGIVTTPITSNTNSLVKLPHNAVITGITPAPQEAPYGSTIYISAPPNDNNQIPISNSTDISITNTEVVQPHPEIITLKDDTIETSQATSEKRRKVSLVCNNPGYDLNSQSIAVNAVINKLLPENVKDIELTKTPCEKLNTVAVCSTIGSTTIKRVSEKPSGCQQQQPHDGTSSSVGSMEPVVFDVSFEGGIDEPTASIVIKPTSPAKPSTSNTLSSSIAVNAHVTPNSSTISQMPHCPTSSENPVLLLPPVTANSVPNTTFNPVSTARFNIINANNRPMSYKVVRLPTSTASVVAASSGEQMPNNNKTILTQTATMALAPSVASAPSAQQQRSSLPTTNLNAKHPIKITPLTPSPTTKAIIRHIENVSKPLTNTSMQKTSVTTSTAGMQSKDVVKILPSNLQSRCVTIRPIMPKPTAAEVLPTAQQTQLPVRNLKPTTLETATTITSSSSPLALSAPITTPVYTAAKPNSINNSVNIVNPPLLITKVQTMAPTVQKPPDKPPPPPGDGIVPSHIQYGYIVSPIYTEMKFVAKRVMEEFYLKVPSVGILKLMGAAAVNNYLNKHVLKTSEKNTKPGYWKFLPASKAIQIQNHQKSLLVRKTKTNGSKDIQLSTRASTPNSNNSQKVVNVTSMSEPILIDD